MIGQGGVSPVAGSGQGNYPQYHGIFYGAVSNNSDPLKKNRCTLRVPQLLGSAVTTWAMPLTPLVDPPAVGTLVAVMFTGGDLDNPVYLVVYPKVAIETTSANVQPVGVTAAAGSSHKVAAADHVHTLANALESTAGNIQPVAGAASAGTSPKAARADHAHVGVGVGTGSNEVSSGVAGGGDLAATIDLFSRSTAGHTDVYINASTVNINGGTLTLGDGTTSNIVLNPQMAQPPNYPMSHTSFNPNDPAHGGSGGGTWVTGERQFMDDNWVVTINQLIDLVNGLTNSLINHQLMV